MSSEVQHTDQARLDEAFIREIIGRIETEFPVRPPASTAELQSQQLIAEELKNRGFDSHLEPFRFNRSLYANLALHAGVGTLGSLVSGVAPAVALGLHLLAGTSYLLDSTRRGYLLRRLLPWRPSHNLVATLPATAGKPLRRIVLLAHADAAFTGVLFHPRLVHAVTRGDGLPGRSVLERPMQLFTLSQFLLAGCDLLRLFGGPLACPLRPLEAALTVPALATLGLNLEVVLRNQVVPGANDNLSGVAALLLLASRLATLPRPTTELVFVVTGCEEASLGGMHALLEAHRHEWSPGETVFVGLDTLGNGELRWCEVEGEVVRRTIPDWLKASLHRAACTEARFAKVRPFEIPAGGTDVSAALALGYPGVSLTAIDPELGCSRGSHRPEDTLANLDVGAVLFATDFAEQLVRELAGGDSTPPSASPA